MSDSPAETTIDRKCYVQILQGVPLVSEFDLFSDAHEFNFIGFNERCVFTAKLPVNFQSVQASSEAAKCSYQEFTLDCDVISVFLLEGKHHVLDCRGFLHQLNFTVKDEDTADLFDDSTSEDDAGPVRQICRIDSGDVLSACLISSSHIAVLSYSPAESTLCLRLVSAGTFEPFLSITLMKNVLTRPSNAFLHFADSDDVEKAFIMNWFPHFNPHEIAFGYMFVLNCGESACCVQLGLDSLQLGYFFNWPTPCVFASFQRPVIRGEEPSRSSLLLSFDDGAIVRLTCGGGDVLQFSLSSMKCACYVNKTLICSDYSDCQATCLDPVGDPRVLPVKGIISFRPFTGVQSKVLALTNFGGLYLLNPDAHPGENKALIPEVSTFEETVNNINYLEELNGKILLQDRAIKCLATVVNAKNFRFNVEVQVVQIIGKIHVFRVTSELMGLEGSSTCFHADDWHVVFSLSSKSDEKIVQTQQLSRDFSADLPLEFMVNLELEDETLRDYVVEVKLISFVGIGKFRPTLVLGKVCLNVLYFLEPEQSLLVYAATSSKKPSLVDLLRRKSKSTSGALEAERSIITIDVPLTEHVEAASFVEKLLEKSQALWRSEAWTEACAKSSFTVIVAGHEISLTLKDRTATVSSENLALAILMKFALLKLFGTTSISKLDERILIEAEDMLKNLEIMEFSRDGPDVSQLFELFRRKQKVVNDVLTGTSSMLVS